MIRNKTLQDYEQSINQCVRCGACQAHCPAYLQQRNEGAVARGKLAIARAMLQGEVQTGAHLTEDMSMCLLCGSCVIKCPNKVPTDKIVGAVRRELSRQSGVSLTSRAIGAITGSTSLMKKLAQAVRRVSPAVFRKIPASSGLRLRFPIQGMELRTIPLFAPKNLFAYYPEYQPGDPDKPVIGIFAGCGITYLYPEIGKYMIEILRLLGYSIFFPHDQGCCGIPARSAGNGPVIEKLVRQNVAAFSRRRVDYILTGCASCHAGIGELPETMVGPVEEFSSKVMDIHVFLYQQGLHHSLSALPRSTSRIDLTYHDPCHLRTHGITREPRELLQSLPAVRYREMENAGSCCGLGGTFSIAHYEQSQKIGALKAENLKKTGAQYIATACPGCMIQLQDAINQAGLHTQVMHTLELLHSTLTHTADISRLKELLPSVNTNQ
ncbi:(Fe-S)-binding protein [Desulfogranum japonicum]|uniref:(Fe-S)-binding protein n=1 Tax=Desulfogranum japonicum TaxID=231447 RepID=UPI00041696CD|nr:(Fe-S)-binding protein [Desulfogranum japonicum]